MHIYFTQHCSRTCILFKMSICPVSEIVLGLTCPMMTVFQKCLVVPVNVYACKVTV